MILAHHQPKTLGAIMTNKKAKPNYDPFKMDLVSRLQKQEVGVRFTNRDYYNVAKEHGVPLGCVNALVQVLVAFEAVEWTGDVLEQRKACSLNIWELINTDILSSYHPDPNKRAAAVALKRKLNLETQGNSLIKLLDIMGVPQNVQKK